MVNILRCALIFSCEDCIPEDFGSLQPVNTQPATTAALPTALPY